MESSIKHLVRTRHKRRGHGKRNASFGSRSARGCAVAVSIRIEPVAPPELFDVGISSQDQTALETWEVIEDILTRLTRLCPAFVTVEADGVWCIGFTGFKHGVWSGSELALRHAALDTQTYRWKAGGSSGYLVRFLEYRGTDLVLVLSPLAILSQFPQGEELVCRVREFVNRFHVREVSSC